MAHNSSAQPVALDGPLQPPIQPDPGTEQLANCRSFQTAYFLLEKSAQKSNPGFVPSHA